MPQSQGIDADLARRCAAEFVGTAILLTSIVGSGIAGERLAGGNTAVALLANALATGCALAALILTFASIGGAHFNPVVTLSQAIGGGLSWREAPGYIMAQFGGAFAGVAVAHLMFGLPVYFASHHERSGMPQFFSEAISTFGLVSVIYGCVRFRSSALPVAVAAYIMSAYWFTASTGFSNPAVTLARAATDTFSGIRPIDTPGFVAAQIVGGAGATIFFRWLIPPLPDRDNEHAR